MSHSPAGTWCKPRDCLVAEVRGVLRGEWHNDARELLSALPVRGQLV